MSDIREWSAAAGANNATPPDGFPERRMEFEFFNDAMREVMAALAREYDDYRLTATASGSNLSVTTYQTLTEFAPFFRLGFKTPSGYAQTTTPTLTVNSLDALPLVNPDGSRLAPRTLQPLSWYKVVARPDRTWQLTSSQETVTPPRNTVRVVPVAGTQDFTAADPGNIIELEQTGGGSVTLTIPTDYDSFWPIGPGLATFIVDVDASQVTIAPPAGVLIRVNRVGTRAGQNRVVLPFGSAAQARIVRLYRSGPTSFAAWV